MKKIAKTARQILVMLGENPSMTRLLDVPVVDMRYDDPLFEFVTSEGMRSPSSDIVLNFLRVSDGTLVHIEFDEATQTAEFTVGGEGNVGKNFIMSRGLNFLDPVSAASVLDAYKSGERRFAQVRLDNANFVGVNLRGASFYMSSLERANFQDAILTSVQLRGRT